tara:strand:+ start:6350 stop:6544 length:195 start_codon:yes stop_codon:yes gene_type:complete
MKLHESVIKKLVTIYSNYGGYRDEHRLHTELKSLDLSVYTKQTGDKNDIIVLSEELKRYIPQSK